MFLCRANESHARPAVKAQFVEDQGLRRASELNRQSGVSQRRLVTKPKASNEQNKTLKRQGPVRVVRRVGGGAHRMHNLRGTSRRALEAREEKGRLR